MRVRALGQRSRTGSAPTSAVKLGIVLLATLVPLACSDASDSSPEAPLSEAAVTDDVATSAPETSTAGEVDRPVPTGTWDGELTDPQSSFTVHLILNDCGAVGESCGENEYMDPMQPSVVLCAPELEYQGTDGTSFVFMERPGYRADECLPTTLKMRYLNDETLVVDQYFEADEACCTGTFNRVSDNGSPSTSLPEEVVVEGLDGPLSVTDLGGPTTQYSAASADSMWFPVDGVVQRIDPDTGEIVSSISANGAPTDTSGDPQSMAADGDIVWVTRLAERAVARIDPASNEIVETIELSVAPYSLALDGDDLWVTSFDDNSVVRVDTTTGKQTAQIPARHPTGIAVGDDAVWVVEHRDDSLLRIDPSTNTIAATIELGGPGENPVCSMCVENVVFANGSVWTANNLGRSVSRIDPTTNEAIEIPLALRAWSVAASGDSIWASQFEELDDRHVDLQVGGLARIDPATNTAEQIELPATMAVAFGHDSLWVVRLGRRSDVVYRYAIS